MRSATILACVIASITNAAQTEGCRHTYHLAQHKAFADYKKCGKGVAQVAPRKQLTGDASRCMSTKSMNGCNKFWAARRANDRASYVKIPGDKCLSSTSMNGCGAFW